MSGTIRPVAASDAEAMLEIYAPIVSDTAISFELEVPSVDELRRRIEVNTAFAPWLIAEIDGHCAGYAYGGQFRSRAAYRPTVETTVYVAESDRRGGVGRAEEDHLGLGVDAECDRSRSFRRG